MAEAGSTVRKPGRSPKKAATGPITTEARRKMVAEAAYYRAEKRGFSEGAELDDWLGAEQEIDRKN